MSEDYDLPKGELMRGKRGLVMGVANKNSIAWGIAAQLAAQGAELVFTYIDALMFKPEAGEAYVRFERLRREVAAIGEPFLGGFDPATLAQELDALGFELLDDLSDADLVARYDPQDRNRLRRSAHSRVARARVRPRT